MSGDSYQHPPRRPDRRVPRLTRDREGGHAVSEPTAPRGPRPAEEVFAERLAPLIELVERWRARIGTEAGSWPAVPLPGLEPDDPRRLAAEIAQGLPRGRGHLGAAGGRGGAAPWWGRGGG